MDITILVAKILGIYLVVSGLFIIIRGKAIPHLLKDFFDHPATMYLTGIILIFLSSMYLIQYNIWDGTWKTLISLFMWLIVFKGLTYIFMPKMISEAVIRKSKGLFGVYGLIAIIVGVYIFFLN